MIMYAVFAYLALYRLDELGFQKFKEFTMTQDPTKIYNFASYLFNKVSMRTFNVLFLYFGDYHSAVCVLIL
jgi:hypothetical protein